VTGVSPLLLDPGGGPITLQPRIPHVLQNPQVDLSDLILVSDEAPTAMAPAEPSLPVDPSADALATVDAPPTGDGVTPPPPRFRAYTIGELPNGPQRFLIDEILPAHCLAEIHGAPGAGKSFAAIGMMLAIAKGFSFLDRPTMQGGVLYVAAERLRGVARRIEAWAIHHGVSLTPDLPFRIMGDAPQLHQPADVAAFIERVNDSGIKPALIVLDTLSRCLVGVDENQAREMTRAAEALDRIRRATGAAVMVIHHTRKAGDMERGSTVLRGAADVMLALRKDKQHGLALSIEKVNEMPSFDPVPVRLVSVGQSAVLVLGEPTAANAPRPAALADREREALAALRDHPGLSLKQWEDHCSVSKSSLSRWCDAKKGVFGHNGFVARSNGDDGYVVTVEGLAALGRA
jgi:hypothetical protein